MATVKRISTNNDRKDSKKHRNSGIDPVVATKDDSTEEAIFTGIRAFVLPTGMGNSRLSLFKNQILKHGGEIVDSFDPTKVNRAVVDDSVTAARAKLLLPYRGGLEIAETGAGCEPDVDCVCVKVSWLSQCLKLNRLVETANYQIEGVFENVVTSKDSGNVDHDPCSTATCAPPTANEKMAESGDKFTVGQKKTFTVNTSAFICASSSNSKSQNFNEHITDKLQVLAETYKNTKDQWRAMGYEKAISVLKRHGKRITSREEAQALPGIGERLADKIWEIVESGRLRKMEEVCGEDRVKALNLFTNIWGVGPSTAEQFVQQGFRTLEDLQERGNLNRQQKIGLRLYDDILDRMPRDEATQIQLTVREAAVSLVPGLEVVACGSYRRGKATCGDVDVLISHSDGRSHVGLLPRILHALHQSGFLTDDLVDKEENGGQQKYLGVCKLPGANSKHRRLDIIVTPYAEFACSLLYFTGSAHFNRSMRLLARKKGMALSEHSLRDGVMRHRTEKISDGRVLATPTEESVFQHLGLTYRPPAERDH